MVITVLEWVGFLLLLTLLYVVIMLAVGAVVNWFKGRRQRRIDRIEAELDRTAMELRETILQLATELGAEAHEARKALIQESFLASGQRFEPQ